MDLWHALVIVFFFVYAPTSSSAAQENLLLSLSCPSEAECGQHLLNCEPDGVIRIKGAIHGFKSPEAQTYCQARSRDLCLVKEDPCCKFSNSSDCLQLSPKADLDLLYGSCGGRSQCVFRSQHVQQGLCNVTQGYAPFSAIAYACVNRSLLLNPVEARYLVGKEVHLFYPGRVQTQTPQDSVPPRPKPAGQKPTTIRSPFTNLSELLKAEKFRLNQVFGVQGTDKELLAVLRNLMTQAGEESEGVVLSSELVHQDGGEIEAEGENEIDVADFDGNVDFDGEKAVDRKPGEKGVKEAESKIVLQRLRDAVSFADTQSDTLKEIEDADDKKVDDQKKDDKKEKTENSESHQTHGKKSYFKSFKNIFKGFFPGIFTNLNVRNFSNNPPDIISTLSPTKLDYNRNQDAVLDPKKKLAPKLHPSKKLDAVVDPSKKLDAAVDRSGALFHPGEGYKCRVTGVSVTGVSVTGVSVTGGESAPREEVAVSAVYLRLVGTRGCSKVSVVDKTQRTSFRCTREKVTKLAGRQLKTMVTPLNIHLRLGASIWEDDFIWIKFTCGCDRGPLSLHCQEDNTQKDDELENEEEVDWFVVFTGLAVTGAVFFIFFVAAIVYIIHRRKGTFIVTNKRRAKRRKRQEKRKKSGHNTEKKEAPTSHTGETHPSSNNDDTSASSSPASSSSLSFSNLKLPPLPPLPPMPDVTRRSVPAMPTRPAPSPYRHVICSAVLSVESSTSAASESDDHHRHNKAPTVRAAECYLQAASLTGLERSAHGTGSENSEHGISLEKAAQGTGESRKGGEARGNSQPQTPQDNSTGAKGDRTRSSSRGRGSVATWQVVDRHSQVPGRSWQSYDRPPQPATRLSSLGRRSKALSLFSTYSPFQQVMVTDLDADPDPEVSRKSAAQPPCTSEEDGDSVDSTFFDFDSFATGDLSEAEIEAQYDRLYSHTKKNSFKIAETPYDRTTK